jgi:hypothetical protein
VGHFAEQSLHDARFFGAFAGLSSKIGMALQQSAQQRSIETREQMNEKKPSGKEIRLTSLAACAG